MFMEVFGVFGVIIEEFPVVCIAGLHVVDATWVAYWGSISVVEALEPDVSGSSVVEFRWRLRNVSHIPEGIGLFGGASVAIGPPGTVVVRTSSLLSNSNTHWVTIWYLILFVLAFDPDISGGSMVEILWGLRNVSHVPEGVSLLRDTTVAIVPRGTVVVWTGLGGVQMSLLLVMLFVVSVMMFSAEASNLSIVDTHGVTGWGGIISVETADLRFFGITPELLWRAGCMTHIPEIVLFLGSTSVAVVPALGRWLDTVKNNTSVEVISYVGFSLTVEVNTSSLNERSSGVKGRVSSGVEGMVSKASNLNNTSTLPMTKWFLIISVETADL